MKTAKDELSPAIVQVITLVAAAIALIIAIVVPTMSFFFARASTLASMQAEASLTARLVSRIASLNPDMWLFEEARIRGMIAPSGDRREKERRLVFGAQDQLVAEFTAELVAPVVTVRAEIYDSGIVVGRVEIVRSLRALINDTVLLAVPAAVFGALAFMMLRLLPLRLLRLAILRARHLASNDALTGLPNRTLFNDRLDRAVALARREGGLIAVYCIDLDRFKGINDTLGHPAGDLLLTQVTSRLTGCLRDTDTLARLGGDEFAIIQIAARQISDVEAVAERIVDRIAQPFELAGHHVTIGASIGLTVHSGPDLILSQAGSTDLLKEADVALYEAKGKGRSRYCFYAEEMNRQLLERRQLETDIREALRQGQFSLHYQGQFDTASGRLLGAEALLRWEHPTRGNVPPDLFIPLAEETRLILVIGEWVLNEACRQAAAWPALPCVAVNVSPSQFSGSDFVQLVEKALSQSGLAPQRLELEITEGVLLVDTDDTLAKLGHLRRLGIPIAMDDFGTGYSSISYLQQFHFDKIKVDRSFVARLGKDAQAGELVKAVLRMSHALGMRVNAEGVENVDQLSLLRLDGCEEVQGFLFGKPMPAMEFAQAMRLAPASLAENPVAA